MGRFSRIDRFLFWKIWLIMKTIEVEINGIFHRLEVDERTLLIKLLRDDLGLTGTHMGCDTTQCGCCTVHLNGKPVKSCTVLAVRVDGERVTTVEGVSPGGNLHPVQEQFNKCHALQCGFCTPGMIMSSIDIVSRLDTADPHVIRSELGGNLCRCTGYENIVKAIQTCITDRLKDEAV